MANQQAIALLKTLDKWKGQLDCNFTADEQYQRRTAIKANKIKDVQKHLEANGLPCWTDLSIRGQSRLSSRGSVSIPVTPSTGFKSTVQRSMKVACVVLSCITPKYIRSDNCHKDLQLAEALHKPVIPIMLHFLIWPPEGTPHIPRLLFRHSPIDLSSDRLFRRNIGLLVHKVKQFIKH